MTVRESKTVWFAVSVIVDVSRSVVGAEGWEVTVFECEQVVVLMEVLGIIIMPNSNSPDNKVEGQHEGQTDRFKPLTSSMCFAGGRAFSLPLICRAHHAAHPGPAPRPTPKCGTCRRKY